jgi:hypothetical protein
MEDLRCPGTTPTPADGILAVLLRNGQAAVRGCRLPAGFDTFLEIREGQVELTLLGPDTSDRSRAAYWLDDRLRGHGLAMVLEWSAKPPAEALGEWGQDTVVSIVRREHRH